MDLGIASYAIYIPFVEPHHRPSLSQNLVARVRVLEKLVRKWVNIHLRDRRRSAGCVGLARCMDVSGGAKCRHVSLRLSRLHAIIRTRKSGCEPAMSLRHEPAVSVSFAARRTPRIRTPHPSRQAE